MKESELERAIGDYLLYSGFCFYKQNTRGYFKQRISKNALGQSVVLGAFRKDLNPYALTGLPDYVVIYRGFHLGLEVKTPEGKQSPNQKQFEAYLTKKGEAPYHVCRSVDEVKHLVSEFKRRVDALFHAADSMACSCSKEKKDE